jgi:hypothetical protein
MDIAPVGEEMGSFREIPRRVQCRTEELLGCRYVAIGQSFPAKQEVRPRMLGERLPFATLPRLEAAASDDAERFLWLASLIVKSTELYR